MSTPLFPLPPQSKPQRKRPAPAAPVNDAQRIHHPRLAPSVDPFAVQIDALASQRAACGVQLRALARQLDGIFEDELRQLRKHAAQLPPEKLRRYGADDALAEPMHRVEQALEIAFAHMIAQLQAARLERALRLNNRNRWVGVLASQGMGYGILVAPSLLRSVEGQAMHATCQEMRRAARKLPWTGQVRVIVSSFRLLHSFIYKMRCFFFLLFAMFSFLLSFP